MGSRTWRTPSLSCRQSFRQPEPLHHPCRFLLSCSSRKVQRKTVLLMVCVACTCLVGVTERRRWPKSLQDADSRCCATARSTFTLKWRLAVLWLATMWSKVIMTELLRGTNVWFSLQNSRYVSALTCPYCFSSSAHFILTTIFTVCGQFYSIQFIQFNLIHSWKTWKWVMYS